MPRARPIAVCLCVLACGALPAAARPPTRPVPREAAKSPESLGKPETRKDKAGDAAQAKKLDSAERSLEKLRADPRRRRYRDGWDAIAKDLDGASRLPGTRSGACALRAAQVREELWGVSRGRSDALGAVTAYRGVVERYPGSTEAERALAAAQKLAARTGLAREVRELAQRVKKDQRDTKLDAAVAHAQAAREAARAEEAPLEKVRAAQGKDRAAQVPVEVDEAGEAGEGEATPQPVAPQAEQAKAGPRERAQPPPQEASPNRESESDVPAEAKHMLDLLVNAARLPGADGLLEGRAQASPGADARPGAKADAPAVASETAKGAEGEETEELPEPEVGELVAIPGPTRASAPKDELEVADADLLARARSLRSLLLGSGHGSIAAELGLSIHKIVLDPGHGGRDTGAIGKNGVKEKDVALAIAKKAALRLKALGFEVVLTREKDVYLTLEERTRLANEAGADLFLSVHCNSARKRTLSGVETWTLNVAADRYSKRLAALENKDAGRRVSDLKLILADLFTKVNAGDARELAQAVQSAMVRTVRSRVGAVKDNGVKHALFYVLLGAKMPAVLVETAFLSNANEEKRLKGPKYQDASAEAIARGVKDFVDARRKLALAD